MDPRSYMPPIPFVGLTPRLDTLDGKKIGILNYGGGNQEAMEPLAATIMSTYPGCEAEYRWGADTKGQEVWDWLDTGFDAIIFGINY